MKSCKVNDDNYLDAIDHLIKGYYDLAEAYHNYHVSGFSDWKNAFQFPDVGEGKLAETIADNIHDDVLSKAFNSMKEQLQVLKKVDRQITDWLTGFVGLSSLQDDKDKVQLEKRLQKIIVNSPDGHPQGPVWLMHPGYQVLVEKSGEILADMNKIRRQAYQRYQKLKRYPES